MSSGQTFTGRSIRSLFNTRTEDRVVHLTVSTAHTYEIACGPSSRFTATSEDVTCPKCRELEPLVDLAGTEL